MNDALLSIRDLRVEFATAAGAACAVDGVSFDIRRGEVFALVGESGCGKSVTALSILDLIQRPSGRIAGGEIRFEGRDLARLSPRAMRSIRGNRIAMIFQEPMTALNPVFTVGYQIEEALRIHQRLSPTDARARAVELLDRVGIPDPAHRVDEYPHQLSGGMRQRVMIAMAVGCRPALLIADEPTTALDVTVQAQVFELLKDLVAEQGTSVLLITHDMGVVYGTADRVAVMYAGRIVEEATREDLFNRPSHPYTRLLLRSIPSRAVRGRRLATIEGMVPPATAFPPGCRFADRCPFAQDRCREATPPDVDLGDGHRAACLRLGEPGALNLPGGLGVDAASSPEPDSVGLVVESLKVHFPIRRGLMKRVTGHVRAVDGVDLAVARGETLALVGESGCGKTTVGRALVRLSPITGGRVKFHGVDITGLPRAMVKAFRRRIQVIFQDPQSSLNPRMTVGESILEGMETHGVGRTPDERRDRMAGLLARVGLAADMAGRYPHEFSGGQRQRIGLARALAVEPELIVCDEATSSLDVSVQAQVLNLFRDLQADLAISYLFITHDLGVVRVLAHRVAVMYLGRIVEEGTTAEVLDAAKHPYTVALLSAVPRIGEDGVKRIVLEGDVPSPAYPPSGCPFHPRCPRAMPVCRERDPAVSRFSATHRARCWLYAADGKPNPADAGPSE